MGDSLKILGHSLLVLKNLIICKDGEKKKQNKNSIKNNTFQFLKRTES